MHTQFSANYSVSVQASLPGNGLIMYDFPDFDQKISPLVQAVESVQPLEKFRFSVEDRDESILISMKRFSDTVLTWEFKKDEQSVGFQNLHMGRTWGKAHEENSIRILYVLGRYFPVDLLAR